jgi:hypothetical protein
MTARRAMKLDQRTCKEATSGYYGDGAGLWLAVGPNSKSWVFKGSRGGARSSRHRPAFRKLMMVGWHLRLCRRFRVAAVVAITTVGQNRHTVFGNVAASP